MTLQTRFMAVLLTVLASVCLGAFEPPAMAAAQAQPSQQEEFVPIDQLPPQEQLAAGPLLVGAYAFVLAALFFYFVTVSRRLTAIQREVDRLEADLSKAGRT